MLLPVFKIGYTPMLPPLLAMLTWMAGLFLLWATRFTSTLHPRLGRGYYALSAVMRPLGIVLIGFGWLEVMGQGEYSSYEEINFLLPEPLLLALSFTSQVFMFFYSIILYPFILFLFLTIALDSDYPEWIGSVHPELIMFFGAFMFSMWSVVKLGIRRSFLYRKADEVLMTSGPYAVVRHPQLLAAMLMVYSTYLNSVFKGNFPLMGDPFLLVNVFYFCVLTYIMILFEERDLLRNFDDEYLEYKKKVPRIFPRLIPRWDRVCKNCGRVSKKEKFCDVCGGVIKRKIRPGYGSVYKYALVLVFPATIFSYLYGVSGSNLLNEGRLHPRLSNRQTVKSLKDLRDNLVDLGPLFQQPGQENYQDEILMEAMAESLEFGIENFDIDWRLQDGMIFCVGNHSHQVTDLTYMLKSEERRQIRAYAEKVCPKLSGYSSGGFTALAIGNIDFDPMIHVIGINDKSDVFCLANDLPRYQFSPPRESPAFPEDVMPYQGNNRMLDMDALYGHPCEDPSNNNFE